MNVLNCHLEALAFNYVKFGFLTLVNNLWIWVAVITAAVSFWRLKAAGFLKSNSPDHLKADGSQHPVLNLTPSDSTVEPPPPPSTTASASASEKVVSSVSGDCDVKYGSGVTKGRFTVYYGEVDRESERRLTAAEEEWEKGSFDVFGVGGGELEKVVRMRMGVHDTGWYSFQDLTVLNGNVVKLWDGC